MSYWIQTAKSTPAEYVDVCFPRIINASVFAMDHTAIPKAEANFEETLPPVKIGETYGHYRYFTTSLDANDPFIFGIFAQFSGSKYWLMMAPTESVLPMRFWNGDFPPAGNHPTKFRITGPPYQELKYIFSPFYNLYLRVNTAPEGDFTLVSTPDSDCLFQFHTRTSLGPVIPSPIDKTVSLRATYFIRSRFGKYLTSSLTAPYLTQTPLNTNSTNQQFFMRAVTVPNQIFDNKPFSYNVYFTSNPDTMLTIEDNGSLGVRTAAGPWEELAIAPDPNLGTFPEMFGKFKIESVDSTYRLRAMSNGTFTTVTIDESELLEDYFNFFPVESGVPYLT